MKTRLARVLQSASGLATLFVAGTAGWKLG